MYNKYDLMEMEDTQIVDIANSLGVSFSQDDTKESVIYAILEAQLTKTDEAQPTKRKRTRIVKKDTDIVYSALGNEGENFDIKKQRKTKAVSQPLFTDVDLDSNNINHDDAVFEEHQQIEAEEYNDEVMSHTEPALNESEELYPEKVYDENGNLLPPDIVFPKKRGRKSKAQLEIEAEYTARYNSMLETQNATGTHTFEEGSIDRNNNFVVPEQMFESEEEEQDKELLERLKAKVANHNSTMIQEPQDEYDKVWEDDPADGTDFIVVNDLPIEDQAIIPDYDMLDNLSSASAYHNVSELEEPAPQVPPQKESETYDFTDLVSASGVLEVMPEGYGFLRSSDYNYLSSPDDIYLSVQQIKKMSLRTGDVVECRVRPPHDGEKYFVMTSIVSVNGCNPESIRDRILFEHLTPLFPDEKYNLCGNPATANLSTKVVDLFSPIGKGQRALIVAQPKTGKTLLMKDVANAIAANHPEAYLMMLLIDERPEEVTDMARTVNAEVIASTFDEPAERHVKIAGIVLEKAKRMVECGHDVVIFLDSITRLARAYNTVAPASGKILTGGVDANALQKPKRFFGAARNIEGGGSLTIIATALIDTGSKMDEVIFEEFKGTGNMELQLDRALSNKRIFPAVNLIASSTRRDDLLQEKSLLDKMWILRKHISDMNPVEAMNAISGKLQNAKTIDEFIMSMNS